jgi:hypothetical protein
MAAKDVTFYEKLQTNDESETENFVYRSPLLIQEYFTSE